MRTYIFCVLVLMTGTGLVKAISMESQMCSLTGQQATIQPTATAFIAGFFSMHNTETGTGFRCGSINTGEMQSYEAIRWALDRLNKKDEYLNGQFLTDYFVPGIKIGLLAQDYCGDPQNMMGLADGLFPQFGADNNSCSKDSNHLLLGLIGASSSGDSQALHVFAQLHNLPLISYQSTVPVLSDTELYPNFMRTAPPDGQLTEAIVALIRELNWDYVVVVYTDNTYGRGAYYEIRPRLDKAGVCLTAAFATPMDDASPDTINDLLDKVLATDTVGVVYIGNGLIANGILQTANTHPRAGRLQWIVTDSVSLSDDFGGLKYPRGLISVIPAARKITEFEDHWVKIDANNPSAENPWYQDMYMARNRCRLPGATNSEFTTVCPTLAEDARRQMFVQDQYVESAVHSIFTYAQSLKSAHEALCNGVSGLCDRLRDLSTNDFYQQYVRLTNFTYSGDERVESLASVGLDPYNAAAKVRYDGNDIINPTFDVFSFNNYDDGAFKFQSVGSYINGRMELITTRMVMYDEARDNRVRPMPASSCPSTPCAPCLGAIIEPQYLYMPGDVVMNGMFSLHMPGESPLGCGAFSQNPDQGIQLLEAMAFTVNEINVRIGPSRTILNGVKLGMLGFDDCQSRLLTNHLVTEVQQGRLVITDENGDNALDPRKVDAYMGGSNAELALSLAGLMNHVERPMIGYWSVTEYLEDDNMYPFFMRSHYGIRVIAKALVLAVKRNGWNYIQVVYVESMFGKEAVDVLRQVAAEEGICIIASYGMMGDMSVNDIVKQLRSRPEVRPVVLLTLHGAFRMFMEGMKSEGAAGAFQLISVVGNNMQTVKGYSAEADGMISIRFWAPPLNSFRQHLSSHDVETYKTNPWLKEWYENFNNCSFNPMSGQTMCVTTNMFEDPNFEFSGQVASVMYGVYAFAFGLHETLKFYCGDGYRGVCGNFANAKGKGEKLVEMTLRATFTEDGNFPFMFLDKQGNLPFKYYNYVASNTAYKSVGEYDPSKDYFYLENFDLVGGNTPQQLQSQCKGLCLECLYLFKYQKYMFVPGDLIIPGIFDVHYRGDSPFSCDELRKVNGFQYTEAFRFALERINSGTSTVKLNGVQLGGLAFDGCTDPIRSSALVTGMYTSAFLSEENSPFRPNFSLSDLMGWLSYNSDSTVSVADILQKFRVPVVSPGATTPVLDDKSEFSTFFRTVPSDGLVAEAMAKLSQTLGFSYVITLNAPDEGSREAVMKFREYAEMHDICVGASYEFETDGDAAQILAYVLQSTTKVVAVFADPDRYIGDLLDRRQFVPEVQSLTFITNRPWTQVTRSRNKPFGTISFMPDSSLQLQVFREFMGLQSPRLDHPNPWFREFYEEYFECNLAGSYRYPSDCVNPSGDRLRDISEDVWVLPTINAVYALAQGIHLTLEEKCGSTYFGICSAFISDEDTYEKIMTNMDNTTFTDMTNLLFEFIEREANRGLIFKRFDIIGTEEVEGTFSNGVIEFSDKEVLVSRYSLVQARCIGQCLQCEKRGSRDTQFMFTNGDVLIGGLFDISKQGATPYTCGEINGVHGFQLMEAFNWALEYVNLHNGIFTGRLQGVRIGSLIFDTCKSPARAGNLIANYHSRNTILRTSQYRIDPSLIDLYIGPFDSESSIRVADVLNVLDLPQISYGATSLELQDKQKYEYFIRTVPADDKQARAIVAFLKKYEIDNIQVISEFSTVGMKGLMEFKRLAPLNKICITAEYVVGQSGKVEDVESANTINKLRINPDAKVVILWMDDPYPVLYQASNMQYIPGNFSFLATDKLGYGIAGYENLKGLQELVSRKGLITFDMETADFPELDKYLEGKTPSTYTRNPWFLDYFEYIYNCSTTVPNTKYTTVCSEDLLGISRAENYIQDPYALYVINAVFSMALGLDKTLTDMCGRNYYGLCNIFRTNGEKREYWLQQIMDIQFIDNTSQPFYYTPTGESDRGYHAYLPVLRSDGTYKWDDVGSYNDSYYLKMDITYDPEWDSSCERTGNCKCEFPAYQPTRYFKQQSPLDLNIVYVLDIHKAGSDFQCGAIDTGTNFQRFMAFLYAIKLVNENAENRFPGSLKLGGVVLDSCSQSFRIGQDVYSLLSGEPVCGTTSGQAIKPASVVAYMSSNSGNSIALSSMLSPLQITTLSMSATAVELNDKITHSYFLRTVPPDNIQAVVIGQILQRFGWNYVSMVYSNNAYGRSARDTLLATVEGFSPKSCVGLFYPMEPSANLDDAKEVIDALSQQVGSKVVVLFVSESQARLLLQATTEKGLNHRFLWIGSDTWSNNDFIVKDYEETASGAITIQIRSDFSRGFRDFFKSLTFQDRKGIPDDWFEEFYQTIHQCRIQSSAVKKTFTRICSGDELLTDNMILQDPYVLHTIISIFQIAYGLSDIEACKLTGLTIASCLSLQEDRRQLIHNSILTAQHNVLPDDLLERSFNFKFTSAGYGDIGYNILNYRQNLSSGKFEYASLGTYQEELTLNTGDYQSFTFKELSIPSSRCPLSTDCLCRRPDGTNYTLPGQQTADRLYLTFEGKYLDPNTGEAVDIEGETSTKDRFRDIWALIVATLAAIGAFATLCLFVYLLVVYPVRGGTSVLGYMLCFGIILMYVLVFAFIAHANEEICAIRRFCLGLVYSIVYGSLFVKLVDCWRTNCKEDIYEVKYSKIGNPVGLFLSALLVVSVQVIINVEWLILQKPDVTRVIYNYKLWPRCTPDDFYDEGLIMSNFFVMFVIFLCVIMGLAAFGNDKNHFDSRWLLGGVVLTVPCWMVWCLVSALGEYKMRDAAVAIGLLFNATVLLLCGPMRKLYLLNKFQAAQAEEDQLAVSTRDYNSMYGNQYDNIPQLHEGPGSVRESVADDVFMPSQARS